MKTKINITYSNKKWTYFRYLCSGALGRMSTSILNMKLTEGKIEAVNSIGFSTFHS